MKRTIAILAAISLAIAAIGCDLVDNQPPKAASGVSQAHVSVKVQSSGMTIEQENIAARLKTDNEPGSIKHLYVISAYSGQVLIYSTVKGKVTSSGKRLTPTTVAACDGQYVSGELGGIPVNIGGLNRRTGEVIQDDGTYGTSDPYIYWWDTKGVYHQHYVSGGQIIHVSNQPIAVKNVVINMEMIRAEE